MSSIIYENAKKHLKKVFIDLENKMFTKKSKRFELSSYDMKSYIEQLAIILVPFILSNINDITLILEKYTWDAEATAVLVSAIVLLLRKRVKNYESK